MISIHALCEEGDRHKRSSTSALNTFLSTPSARRATTLVSRGREWAFYFYPRPLRGGRPGPVVMRDKANRRFLSTPSARRATPPPPLSVANPLISIHALCEEGDLFSRERLPLRA